jgi:hypothetical protein
MYYHHVAKLQVYVIFQTGIVDTLTQITAVYVVYVLKCL